MPISHNGLLFWATLYTHDHARRQFIISSISHRVDGDFRPPVKSEHVGLTQHSQSRPSLLAFSIYTKATPPKGRPRTNITLQKRLNCIKWRPQLIRGTHRARKPAECRQT